MNGTASGDTFQGVSNCYVFKSRLQEFAQKVGLPTPTYETIKEGPSHEPTFKSTVIVNDVRYDSLPGFFNRKAAEQSAAEIALLALSRSGNAAAFISQPTHETGLCKNLLQEYAQKMNHAIPLYECKRDETCGRIPMFSCTVEIGGMKYIGGAAKTKKEAEIKAARTAMLAIQATSSGSHLDGQSNYTVIPIKKKLPDSGTPPAKDPAALKPRKRQFKKKPRKNNMNGVNGGRNRYVKNTSRIQVVVCDQSLTGLGDANADVDTRVNANVDTRVNGNGNGNGDGIGNVDAHINANGNGDVNANVNVNANGDGSVNGMDAAYDPCSNRGGEGEGEGEGEGDGDGDNSRLGLIN